MLSTLPFCIIDSLEKGRLLRRATTRESLNKFRVRSHDAREKRRHACAGGRSRACSFLATGAGVYFAWTSTQQGPTKTVTVGGPRLPRVLWLPRRPRTWTPTVFTYDAAETDSVPGPERVILSYDYNIMQNVYEPLIWFNGTCGTCVLPWLAASYTPSSDLKTYTFTLRSGIKFADGEALNSTSVYFALNRILLEDGSTTVDTGLRHHSSSSSS